MGQPWPCRIPPWLSGFLTPVDAADVPRPGEQGGWDALPAAGPQPGCAPGPDLGGDFCFCFPLVLLKVNSIHLGLSGRFGEIYIYFFFLLWLMFYFQEDDSLHRGREGQAGRGAEAGYASTWRPWPPPCGPGPAAGRERAVRRGWV